MNKEFFKIIKEINSLEAKLDIFQNLKADDKKRINRLFDQKNHRQEDLNEASSKKDALQKELFSIDRRTMEIEKTLKENNQKLNTIFDETITSKLEKLNKELSSELDEIQERGLSLLEEIEEVKEEITNAQNFLNGIDETIDEIKAEIFEKQGLENESEKHVQERISQILNDLPIDFQTKYLKLKKDSPHHNSLSVVKDKKCQFCHYEINSRKLEAIEIKFELHKCDMCKRILIPEQASY